MKRWMVGLVVVAVIALNLPAGAQPLRTCPKSFQECIDDMMRELTTRGWFGMLLGNSEMTPDGQPIPEDLKILVFVVMPEGPAMAAGFHVGDVILTVHGKPFRDLAVLNPEREKMKVGEEVAFTVLRDGEKKDLKLTLTEAPANIVGVWLGQHLEKNYLVVKNELVQ